MFGRVVGGSKDLFTLFLLFLWQSPFTSAESTPNQNNKLGKLPVPASKNQGKINRFTHVMNGKQGSKLVSSTCPQDVSHENTLLVEATLHFARI